jgi:hypothetical protein
LPRLLTSSGSVSFTCGAFQQLARDFSSNIANMDSVVVVAVLTPKEGKTEDVRSPSKPELH